MVTYSHYYDHIITLNQTTTPMPVILASGEFDIKLGATGVQQWLKHDLFHWPQSAFRKRQIYYLKDKTSVGGYFVGFNGLQFVTVPKAGYYLPTDYYNVSKQLLDDLITNKSVVCHADTCGTGKQMCQAMDQCRPTIKRTNQTGTCDQETGFCRCEIGFKGADCGHRAIASPPTATAPFEETYNGTKTYYF